MWLSCLCLPALLVCLFVFFTLFVQLNQHLSFEVFLGAFIFTMNDDALLLYVYLNPVPSLSFTSVSNISPAFLAPSDSKHASPVSLIVEVVSVTQSYLTLCDTMDCSPPASSVHGILQARIPAWVDIFISRGSSHPGDRTQVSCTAGRFCTVWATEKPMSLIKYLVITFAVFIPVVVHVSSHVFLTLF